MSTADRTRATALMLVSLVALQLTASTAAVAVSEAPTPPRAEERGNPLFLVHGSSPMLGQAGIDVTAHWRALEAAFTDYGWTGPKYRIAFYECDKGEGRLDISEHGLPAAHDKHLIHNDDHSHKGSKCGDLWAMSFGPKGLHDRDTSIEHLAYHLAWAIHDKTPSGQCAEIVAQEMGGLIVRYMIAQIGKSPDFPGSLCIDDVVALDVPWFGTIWATTCAATTRAHQCQQMSEKSSFVQSLEGVPLGAADWTVIGSSWQTSILAENAVGYDRARQPQRDIPFHHKVTYNGISASAFLSASAREPADHKSWETIESNTRANSYDANGGPGPLRMIYLSLVHKSFGCGTRSAPYPLPPGRWIEGDHTAPECYYILDTPSTATLVTAETWSSSAFAQLTMSRLKNGRAHGDVAVCDSHAPNDEGGKLSCFHYLDPPTPRGSPWEGLIAFCKQLPRALQEQLLAHYGMPGGSCDDLRKLPSGSSTDVGERMRELIQQEIERKIKEFKRQFSFFFKPSPENATFIKVTPAAGENSVFTIRAVASAPNDCRSERDAGKAGPEGAAPQRTPKPVPLGARSPPCTARLDRVDDTDTYEVEAPVVAGKFQVVLDAEQENAVPIELRWNGERLATATPGARVAVEVPTVGGGRRELMTVSIPAGPPPGESARYRLELRSNGRPYADLACPGSAAAKESITCSISAADDDPQLTYTVDWGDGTRDTFIAAAHETLQRTHRYDRNGEFEVTLTVKDSAPWDPQEVSLLSRLVAITGPNTPPRMIPPACTRDQTQARISWTCSFAAEDDDSQGVRLNIDWGDGKEAVVPPDDYLKPGETRRVNHPYDSAGPFEISVTAKDSFPGRPSFSQAVSQTLASSDGRRLVIHDVECLAARPDAVRCRGLVREAGATQNHPRCQEPSGPRWGVPRVRPPCYTPEEPSGEIFVAWGEQRAEYFAFRDGHFDISAKMGPGSRDVHFAAYRAGRHLPGETLAARACATECETELPAPVDVSIQCKQIPGHPPVQWRVGCDLRATDPRDGPMTAVIDWGDGKSWPIRLHQDETDPIPHGYSWKPYDAAGVYNIRAFVSGKGVAVASTTLTVQANERPDITTLGCGRLHGLLAICQIGIYDDGATHRVVIDWGDGSPPEEQLISGSSSESRSLQHMYAPGRYRVTALVVDNFRDGSGPRYRASELSTAMVVAESASGLEAFPDCDRLGCPRPPKIDSLSCASVRQSAMCALRATSSYSQPVYYVIDWGDSVERYPATGTIVPKSWETTKLPTHTYRTAKGSFPITVWAVESPSVLAAVSEPRTARVELGQGGFYQIAAARPTQNAPPVVEEVGCYHVELFDASCSFIVGDDGSTPALTVDWGEGGPTPVAIFAAGENSAEHSFSGPGVYRIELRATDANGATTIKTVDLRIPPGPNESPSPPTVDCRPHPRVSLSTTCWMSATDDSGEVSFLVDWGDGSATERMPTIGHAPAGDPVAGAHTYERPGQYTVSVTAADGTEPGWSSAPTKAATTAQTLDAPSSIREISCHEAAPLVAECWLEMENAPIGGQIEWQWGDETPIERIAVTSDLEASLLTATHRYAAPRTTTITARLAGAPALAATTTIAIEGERTAATFAVDCSTYRRGPLVRCVLKDFDEQGPWAEYAIDWGDGKLVYASPSGSALARGGTVAIAHAYTEEGDYRVTVAARSDEALLPAFATSEVRAQACKDACAADHVMAEATIETDLSVSCDRSARPPWQVTCRLIGSTAHADRLRYFIDWGDGKSEESPLSSTELHPSGTMVTLSHQYAPETSIIRIGAIAEAEEAGPSSWVWKAWRPKPNDLPTAWTIDCGPPAQVITGGLVGCVVAGGSPSATHSTYWIDWGDGTTESVRSWYAESAAIVHRYAHAGEYAVSFVVEDEASGARSAPLKAGITVQDRTPGNDVPAVKEFACTPAKPQPGGLVTCTIRGDSPEAMSFDLLWGDEGAPTELEPPVERGHSRTFTHRYAQPGAYTLRASASNNHGTAVLNSVIVVDGPRPRAPLITSFDCNTLKGIPGTAITCAATSSGGAGASYYFTWSDEKPGGPDARASAAAQASRTFHAPGIYTLTVTATRGGAPGSATAALSISIANSAEEHAPIVREFSCDPDKSMVRRVECHFMADDSQRLRYHINWGDGDAAGAGPNDWVPAGSAHSRAHTFEVPGRYEISIYAEEDTRAHKQGMRTITIEVE